MLPNLKAGQKSAGGARPGAGRKKLPPELKKVTPRMMFYFSDPGLREQIKEAARAAGVSDSRFVAQAVEEKLARTS